MEVVKGSILAWFLFGVGGTFLVAGALLAYPYLHSRVSMLTAAPTAIPPASTATATPPMEPVSTATHLPTAVMAPSPAPTSTPLPSEPPSRIVIPAIGLDAPVVPIDWGTVEVGGQEQAAWEVPDRCAVGWHGTSAPLGQPGNTVLNGHNTTHGEVFRYLYTLEVGDVITVHAESTSYAYTVSEKLVIPEGGRSLEVRRKNARYIMPTEDERLTLVTCHPYASLKNRLIVIAHPADRSAVGDADS